MNCDFMIGKPKSARHHTQMFQSGKAPRSSTGLYVGVHCLRRNRSPSTQCAGVKLKSTCHHRHTPLLLFTMVMKVMLFHRETSQCEVHPSVRCTSNVHHPLFLAPHARVRTESENVLALKCTS